MLLPQRARWLSRRRSGCHERCRRWGMRQGGISLSLRASGRRRGRGADVQRCSLPATRSPQQRQQQESGAGLSVKPWEPLLQSSASDLLSVRGGLTAFRNAVDSCSSSDYDCGDERCVDAARADDECGAAAAAGYGGEEEEEDDRAEEGRCSRGAAAAVARLSRFVSVQSRVSCPPRVSLSRPLHRSAFRQAKASLPCSAVCCSQPVKLLLSAASCRTRSLVLASADTESRAALNHEFAAAATTEPPSCGC